MARTGEGAVPEKPRLTRCSYPHGLKSGKIFDRALTTSELLNDYTCVLVEVPKSSYREHVGFCRWYYQGNTSRSIRLYGPLKTEIFHGILSPVKKSHKIQPVFGVSNKGA